MSNLIDISVLLQSDMPIWPGSTGYDLKKSKSIEAGDSVNVSHLSCDVHVGTHIDTPLHHLPKGASVEQISLDDLIGPATVIHLPEVRVINKDILSSLALPSETKRLLIRTKNSQLWESGVGNFEPDYVAMTEDAAQWVVQKGIRLVGIDYLSIQMYEDGPAVHQILLRAGVVIIEGLNLLNVQPGEYELICLPLKLLGSEGAPARAILRPLR